MGMLTYLIKIDTHEYYNLGKGGFACLFDRNMRFRINTYYDNVDQLATAVAELISRGFWVAELKVEPELTRYSTAVAQAIWDWAGDANLACMNDNQCEDYEESIGRELTRTGNRYDIE